MLLVEMLKGLRRTNRDLPKSLTSMKLLIITLLKMGNLGEMLTRARCQDSRHKLGLF